MGPGVRVEGANPNARMRFPGHHNDAHRNLSGQGGFSSGPPMRGPQSKGLFMNNIIYLVGLVVVVLAVLSFFGMR